MKFDNYTVQDLREDISASKNRLANPSISSSLISFYNDKLIALEHELEKRFRGDLNSYGRILRPAQREILFRLRRMYRENKRNALIRDSYISAYFGTCVWSVFQRPEFVDLKSFFPVMKLPLVAVEADTESYKNQMYRDVSLSKTIRNFICDYKQMSRGKPNEYVEKLWFPILLSFVNSVKLRYNGTDLHLIPKFDAREIKINGQIRDFDYAVADGHEGLPILLVEVANNPDNYGALHKDTRKMALSMAHILMQLVKRAKSNCPNCDVTKFRVFGLLIEGSEFECCVGSVIQNDSGQINFMFNSERSQWKFDLLSFIDELNVESDLLCSGDEIQVSYFVDDSSRSFDNDSIGLFVETTNFDEAEEQITSDIGPDNEIEMASSIKSEAVLWKFISLTISYYSNLDDCLKKCIKTAPSELLEASLVYKFPPEEAQPCISSVSNRRQEGSLQSSVTSSNVRTTAKTADQQFMYKHLYKSRFPTLPDVLFYDPDSKVATVRYQNCHFDTFSEMIKKSNEVDEDGRIPRFYVALIQAKFTMDMLMAAYKFHSMGFVCGSFELPNTTFDGLFFHVDYLSNIVSEDKCGEIDVNNRLSFDKSNHIESDPPRMSKRDDLYSIFMSIKIGMNRYLRREILWECNDLPNSQKFVDSCFMPLHQLHLYPELDAGEMLKTLIPIYDEMVKDYAKPDMKYISATRTLAKQVLEEIKAAKSESKASAMESVSQIQNTISSESKQ